MYNQSAGSMYEEIEAERLKKEHHKKVIIRRIIAIALLSLVVVYLVLLFIDTRRFKKGEYPLITIGINTKEYDDGHVTTYYSIGWIFRYYERETIKDAEIAPFYSKIRLDNVLKRVNDPNLPEVEKDFVIPDNPLNQEKIGNVLFFYDGDNLLGNYACLLSESDCEISYSEQLGEESKKEPRVKMSIIDNRYVFITEYKNKDTKAEEKYVYLYDIVAKSFIAQYEGVRYTKVKDEKGYIDSSKYIIKKNGYWGIDQVIKGLVSNFEDYQYKYIKYDEDSSLYIFQKQNDRWAAFNAENKTFTKEISQEIDDLYLVDEKIYMITYEQEYNSKKDYRLFNQDGENVLSKNDIDNLVAYSNYLVYTNDGYLYVINYDGDELIKDIKIYLSSYEVNAKVKQYTVQENNGMLIIKVPQAVSSTHLVDEYYYELPSFKYKDKRTAQETISY